MGTDTRHFCTSFSVKVGTKRRRFELSPAELHGGAEGQYRVRIDRRWHDSPEGITLCLDKERIATLIVNAALGAATVLPPCPEIPSKDTRCSVRWEDEDGEHWEQGWTKSPAIRAYDGLCYVAVYLYEKGTVFMPATDIIVRKKP